MKNAEHRHLYRSKAKISKHLADIVSTKPYDFKVIKRHFQQFDSVK